MLLKNNASVLFVGINPSLEPSQGFFGTPKNQFFSLLKASGFYQAENDTVAHEVYNMGFINYVDRPTKSEKDLGKEELSEGKRRLQNIVEEYQPRVVCFVGKKCCKYQLYVAGTKNDIEFGL
ncbi:uracil-DNA glycosylase-like protein [Pilaira anomala]|nr:uracil-DNA glycosylase-like protein [Pilaira anomala]